MDKPSLSEYVAREIRAHLGRERVSVSALARRLGWSQSYLARRVDGRVPFDLDDLERVADALSVRLADLLPAPDAAHTLRNREPVADLPERSTPQPDSQPERPRRNPRRQSTRPGSNPPAGAPDERTRRPSLIRRAHSI